MRAGDAWLVGRLDVVTQAIQRTIGLDCFWWMRRGAELLILVRIPMGFGTDVTWMRWILGLVLIGVLLEAHYHPDFRHGNVVARLRDGMANPRKVREASWRTIMVALLGLHVALAIALGGGWLWVPHGLYLALWTAVTYLQACDPLPPVPSRHRAWLTAPRLVPARTSA